MSFDIIFKKRFVSLSIGNSLTDEILGNFTCKIAAGEWDSFISLGLIDKPDENLSDLANIILGHCFKPKIQATKISAYAEIVEKYGSETDTYVIRRTIIPPAKKRMNPEIADVYTTDSLKDLIFLEMLYASEQNMHISRCKNCLKYFASAYSGADYCDRVNPEGKTCKWTGSKKTYASNIKADENLVLYEKIYQSLQYKRRRTTDAEMLEKLNFNIILLTKCRAKYRSGEHSADKFLEKIEEIKNRF